MKKALICGISGQDGAFLAQFLLKKGYRIAGTSRQSPQSDFDNLERLGIRKQLKIVPLSLKNSRQIRNVLTEYGPDEIYNLAGQSSVGLSFERPDETYESIATAGFNLLTAVRDAGLQVRVFMAGSGDMFGDLSGSPARESTPPDPVSPYGEAKAMAFQHTGAFREKFGLFACTGILFNHESFFRPAGFVTRKIVRTACEIARGNCRELLLGNTVIQRDWGWLRNMWMPCGGCSSRMRLRIL